LLVGYFHQPPSIDLDGDRVVGDADQLAAKIALPVDRVGRFQLDPAPGKPLVICALVQTPLDAWRRNLEDVPVGNQIIDVQQRSHLLTHDLAIAVIDTPGLVDVNPQNEIVPRAYGLPVNYLEPFALPHAFDDASDGFSVQIDHCPQEKKW